MANTLFSAPGGWSTVTVAKPMLITHRMLTRNKTNGDLCVMVRYVWGVGKVDMAAYQWAGPFATAAEADIFEAGLRALEES